MESEGVDNALPDSQKEETNTKPSDKAQPESAGDNARPKSPPKNTNTNPSGSKPESKADQPESGDNALPDSQKEETNTKPSDKDQPESARDNALPDSKKEETNTKPSDKAQHKLATTLPLFALNHISLLVQNLDDAAHFYQKVMGFVIIQRPNVFDFEGVWMFGHGVAVHLLGLGKKPGDNKCGNKREHTPIDNHVSFQCSNLYSMMRMLETSGLKFTKYDTKQGGKVVTDRIIFHDPDGNMIEITNYQKLPIVPLSTWPPQSMPTPNLEFGTTTTSTAKEMTCRPNCCTCDHEQGEENSLDNTANEPHLLAMNHVGFLCESLKKSVKFYKDVLEFVRIETTKDECLDQLYNREWLFGHGIGIHLMETKKKHNACPIVGREIDPQDNHIAFQCTNMYNIIRRLDEKGYKMTRPPDEKGSKKGSKKTLPSDEKTLPSDEKGSKKTLPSDEKGSKKGSKKTLPSDEKGSKKYKFMDIKEGGIIVNQLFVHDPDGNMIEFCNCQNLPVYPVSACPPQKMPTPNLDLISNKELPCKRKNEEEYCVDLCRKRRTMQAECKCTR